LVKRTTEPTEDQEQIALMHWARLTPICRDYLIHIPNGGSRNVLEAKKFKAMGVKAGVSDLFLAYPSNRYGGLWIELKRKGGKLTEPQRHWLSCMNNLGYKACVCYGWGEAKLIIE
jgi:hypothetical protein